MIDWLQQQIRLTLFSSTTIKASEEAWTALAGQEEAESRQSIPGGGKRYVGPAMGGQLAVSVAANRLDVLLQPSETPEPGLPNLGSRDAVVAAFVEAVEKWIPSREFPILRIAHGEIISVVVSDRRAAYVALQSMLQSVTIDPDRMRDFFYRINWPRDSAVVDGLNLNLITNWAAVSIFSKLVHLAGEQLQVSPETEEIMTVRLDIDHNTDGRWVTPLEISQVLALHKELVRYAGETASKGESK